MTTTTKTLLVVGAIVVALYILSPKASSLNLELGRDGLPWAASANPEPEHLGDTGRVQLFPRRH